MADTEKQGAASPADEFEITAEMIAAGANEFLAQRGLEIGTPETAAFAIFSAMASVSPLLRTYCLVDLAEDADYLGART